MEPEESLCTDQRPSKGQTTDKCVAENVCPLPLPFPGLPEITLFLFEIVHQLFKSLEL
jgi:hypothetical protein